MAKGLKFETPSLAETIETHRWVYDMLRAIQDRAIDDLIAKRKERSDDGRKD